MKKKIIMLLIVLVICFIFVCCGGTKTQNDTTSKEEISSSETEIVLKYPTTYRLYVEDMVLEFEITSTTHGLGMDGLIYTRYMTKDGYLIYFDAAGITISTGSTWDDRPIATFKTGYMSPCDFEEVMSENLIETIY